MHRDTVNPGLQAGLAVKMVHAAKHFQKDFLRGIGRVGGIGDDAIHKAVDRLVEFSDEPGVGVFRASLQFGHNRRLLGPDSYRDCKITQGGCSRHYSHGVTPIIGSFGPKAQK